MFKPVRWSGERDKYFGPFTFFFGERNEVGFSVKFGDGYERPESFVRIHLLKFTAIFPIPSLVKPWKEWVDTSRYNWSKPPHGYWETGSREYGLSFSASEMHWRFGPQKHRWPNGGSGCWFYPWRDHKLVGRTYTDADGKIVEATEDEKPVAVFLVNDFDGELVEAKVAIEHLKYRIGKGLWHWLMLGKTKTYTKLHISFSAETGRRKGGWKGGTIGVSTQAEPSDQHATAMRRYCEKNDMKLIGVRGVAA